jgi:hypothetical protein
MIRQLMDPQALHHKTHQLEMVEVVQDKLTNNKDYKE